MSTEIPPSRAQSEALQILATEHWSLLATRSLTLTESLGRVSMFLGVLFFVGVATVRRLVMLNFDDYRWVVGMNRLRHAYLELHPELEPNFITSHYDDLPGALQTLGIDTMGSQRLGSVFHGFITLPG